MIVTPNRLSELRASVEKGEPVDLRRLAALQALDAVLMGREFTEDAIRRHEIEDERIARELKSPAASDATEPARAVVGAKPAVAG